MLKKYGAVCEQLPLAAAGAHRDFCTPCSMRQSQRVAV